MKTSGLFSLVAVALGLVLLMASVAIGSGEIPSAEVSDLAYETVNGRFLHVYEDLGDIFGQFYSNQGSYVGSPFVISDNPAFQYAPQAAYATTHQMFLVVWDDGRGGGDDIYGQFVTAAGDLHDTASSTNFPICVAASQQQSPEVDYDPVTDRFLVAWADRRINSSAPDIYGQFVTTSDPGYLFSTISTQNFPIAADSRYGQHSPAVGYDSAYKLFLVAFMDYRDADNNIYGQFVDAADMSDFLYSTALGTNFPIGTTPYDKANPSLAYDSDNGRHLVVWDQNFNELEWDIAGQIVDASSSSGFLYSTGKDQNITISDNLVNWQNGPRAAYHPDSGYFLTAWTDYRGFGGDVYGQALAAGGTLIETDSINNYPLVTSGTVVYTDPVGAAIPGSDKVIVVYKVDDTYWEAAVYDPTPDTGGGGGGCNTSGPAPGEPIWPEILWIALLGWVFILMRRRVKG